MRKFGSNYGQLFIHHFIPSLFKFIYQIINISYKIEDCVHEQQTKLMSLSNFILRRPQLH